MRHPPTPSILSTDSLPRIWLMTDARNDQCLESVIFRLPAGSGIIFRHYHLGDNARRERFMAIRRLARKKRHLLLLADRAARARDWGADGIHGRQWLSARYNRSDPERAGP